MNDREDIDAWAKRKGWPVNPSQKAYATLVAKGTICEAVEKMTSKKHVGTPEQILDLRSKSAPGFFRT